MEKKKVSVLTLLLVIAVIVIVVMGAYIYKVNMSQKVVSNNTVANNTENERDKEISDELIDENVEEVAKELIGEYLEISPYERSNIGPMPYILVELGLETEENITELCKGVGNKEDYIKSNTKYEEFKNALLEYVSEEYFIIYYAQYKNMDGYVGFCNCAGGSIPLGVEEVKLISKDGDIYTFDVTFKDLELYDHYMNGEDIAEDEYLFNSNITCKLVNNKLVIDEFLNGTIILEGYYIIDPSDVGYEFKKDGTVEYTTNLTSIEGTYRTVGENEIESEHNGQVYKNEFVKMKTIIELSENDYVTYSLE